MTELEVCVIASRKAMKQARKISTFNYVCNQKLRLFRHSRVSGNPKM
jgi:hypothetical protein